MISPTEYIAELTKLRKQKWVESKGNVDLDKQLTTAIADKVIKNEALRKTLMANPILLIELIIRIVDKEGNARPFFFNEPQQLFLKVFRETLKKNYNRKLIVLKGRQMGFTTLITAIQLCYAIFQPNFSGYTIADVTANAETIFNDKAKLMYDGLPECLKPHEKYNSRREMFFDNLKSAWRVDSADGEVGRSRTPRFVHYSEAAFFKSLSSLQASMGQAIPKSAVVIYESTANGYNDFHELWDSKTCKNCFYEWWLCSDYTYPETDIIKDVEDDWLLNRIKWLREQHLRDDQIAWYVHTYNGLVDKDLIRQEYPCFPEDAFLSTGRCFFPQEQVMQQLADARKISAIKGEFTYDYDGLTVTNPAWRRDNGGCIKIFEEPKPNYPYVIGGDTAGEGSDSYTAVVINNTNGKIVATLKLAKGADYYARQVFCLGKYYNDAVIGVEVNFDGAFTSRELLRLGYHRLYVRPKEDTYTGELTKAYGFQTNRYSRQKAIETFRRDFTENPENIPDAELLEEMLVFCYDDKGKAQALQGKHDDLVMGASIATCVRQQQRSIPSETAVEDAETRKWTEDMYEDYYKASKEDKAYLRSKWGKPPKRSNK